MQVIAIHERQDEMQQIAQALQACGVKCLVQWAVAKDFDECSCTADTLVVLHASNECQDGSLAEQLVEQYAAPAEGKDTRPYAVLGNRLSRVCAKGVVVVSNEYCVSKQLVDSKWARVWPCSLDQFVETIALLIESLQRDDVPPWDAFATGLSPLEPALQLLSALLPIGLLWEAHAGDKCKALERLGQADQKGDSSAIEFEQRIQRYARSLVGGDCKEANAVWAEIECEHRPPALDKLGGADDLKSRLEKLCSANSPKEWNSKLKILRDDLLAKADA